MSGSKSFLVSLWDSIFTPGPTPTLLTAMNISFFALTALLIPLAYVTKNIHVFLLTLLSIVTWVVMQWFLVELEKAKKAESQQTQESKKTE